MGSRWSGDCLSFRTPITPTTQLCDKCPLVWHVITLTPHWSNSTHIPVSFILGYSWWFGSLFLFSPMVKVRKKIQGKDVITPDVSHGGYRQGTGHVNRLWVLKKDNSHQARLWSRLELRLASVLSDQWGVAAVGFALLNNGLIDQWCICGMIEGSE